MTVRELRAALEGVPDDMEVLIGYEGTTGSSGIFAGIWSDTQTPDGQTWVLRSTSARASGEAEVPVFVVGCD